MNTHYDVVVAGAGPIGITTACTLKSINKNLKICVIDKRPKPARDHGLSIKGDSVRTIIKILNHSMSYQKDLVDENHVKELRKIFNNWRNSFVRTSTIENVLATTATQMGIDVFRDKIYEVYADKLNALLEPGEQKEFPDGPKSLRSILQNAPVIIAADGAHSVFRQAVIGNKLRDYKILQYVIELKYQTDGNAKPRKPIEGSFDSSYSGFVNFENMNKKKTEDKKPVTYHIFVDKETYDDFRVVEKDGQLKGVYGNSWTLKEIELRKEENKRIQKVYRAFTHELKQVSRRGGNCYEEKISTIELSYYINEESVKIYKGKKIIFSGDSNSGMILERGYNKGLKEAGLCAKTVSAIFQNKKVFINSMPSEFLEYQEQVRQIFYNERWWAEFKNHGIKAAQNVSKGISNSITVISNIVTGKAFRNLSSSSHVDAEEEEEESFSSLRS